MARITVEDSLRQAKNRFALVLLTTQRTRQLLKGSQPLTDTRNNREIVIALREIAAGKVDLCASRRVEKSQGRIQIDTG